MTMKGDYVKPTVDDEIPHQLRLVICPIIYRVLYIPAGARILPSTVPHVYMWAEPKRSIDR